MDSLVILQFALIFEKELGRGAKPGIDSHLPRGKNCRGHLEDENDSQGHGRPLPCPLNYLSVPHKVTPQFLNINLSVNGVTQGPAAGALIHPSGPRSAPEGLMPRREALMGRRQPWLRPRGAPAPEGRGEVHG